MRSAGWALAWEFWGRNRVPLSLLLGYLLAVVLLVQALTATALGGSPAAWMTASVLTLPLVMALPFLIALFSHGDQADINARESGYPRRAFTLPLRTAALVGWPMGVGGLAVVTFWLALAGLILRPIGFPVPLWWPAAFLTALLVWLQALVWWPFPLPLLRFAVAAPVLGGLSALAFAGWGYDVSPSVLLAVFAALVPAGFLLAAAGVARARRGDAPVWNWPALRIPVPASWKGRPFASAPAALFWLDWRRSGFTLPLMTGLAVSMCLLLLLLDRDPKVASRILLVLPFFPFVMASSAGAMLGNSHPSSRKNYLLPAFVAARPVTSATMLAVKLRVAALATLVTWVGLVLVILLVLPLTSAPATLARWWQLLLDAQGAKAWALIALAAVALPWLAWKQIVNHLWIPLAGRAWVVYAASLAFPVGLTALGLFGAWVYLHPESLAALRAAVPWLLGAVLLLRLTLAAWVFVALRRRRLVAARTLGCLAAAWFAGAAALCVLAFWLTPAEIVSPLVVACTAVLVLLPLVRLGLAPLALDWNRHR